MINIDKHDITKELLEDMLKKNYTREDMMKIFGITKGSIDYYLYKYGLSRKKLKKEKLTKELLEDLYLNKKKTCQQIADDLGETYGIINWYLYIHGLFGKGKIRLDIDLDHFIDLYESGMTLQEMAKELGCCYATVRNYVDALGIEKRPIKRNYLEYKDLLYDMYVTKRMSLTMISKEINWPKSRIRTALVECGIPRRNKSDAQLIFLDDFKSYTFPTPLVNNDLVVRCRRYFMNRIYPKVEKIKCEDCGCTDHLHVHHIISMSSIVKRIKTENPKLTDDELFNIIIKDSVFLDMNNLKVVCRDCHYKHYHPNLKYTKVNQQPS